MYRTYEVIPSIRCCVACSSLRTCDAIPCIHCSTVSLLFQHGYAYNKVTETNISTPISQTFALIAGDCNTTE